jgi:hypothetical protein
MRFTYTACKKNDSDITLGSRVAGLVIPDQVV